MSKSKESIKVDWNGGNVTATCTKCGGSITHSNQWGMFCDKECDLEDSKKAFNKLNKMFGGLFTNMIK